MTTFARRMLRMAGPAMGPAHARESLRAGLGAGLGLLVCNLLLAGALPAASPAALLLIAPFGASAFLVFAVPNSPLAQPWSVVVGNTLAALAALGVLALVPHPLLAACLAVALAIALMGAVRALHPPSGAVALATVLAQPDWGFALSPVLLGSVGLVASGILWNRATGRVYPFRQTPETGPHGTGDPLPDRRLALTPQELADLLDRMRMGQNIGVEDLARALSAATTEAASHRLGHLTAALVMSRDLVTLRPDTPFEQVVGLFRRHRFHTLPVTTAEGGYVGLVPQLALLKPDAPRLTAAGLAEPEHRALPPDAGIAALITLMGDGRQQSVPIVQEGKLVGIVTRSDLIGVLTHRMGQP